MAELGADVWQLLHWLWIDQVQNTKIPWFWWCHVLSLTFGPVQPLLDTVASVTAILHFALKTISDSAKVLRDQSWEPLSHSSLTFLTGFLTDRIRLFSRVFGRVAQSCSLLPLKAAQQHPQSQTLLATCFRADVVMLMCRVVHLGSILVA